MSNRRERLNLRNAVRLLVAMTALSLTACARKSDSTMLGTLEWDRVGVSAEASEPILRIAVAEGAQAKTGDVLLELDSRRAQAQLAQAQADAQRAEAQLAELRHGSRVETVENARATLRGAESTALNARRERDRRAEIRKRGLIAQETLDQAETVLRTSTAQADAARSNLQELLHGTRVEQLDQAEAALASAQANAQRLALTLERLSVRAPRDGRVDALPFKLGDQPPLGAEVVSLLAGDAPYARVYVPSSLRATIAIGAHCNVNVEGAATAFGARVRSVRSDPAFTPYYALTGEDASRLAYRAELVLEGGGATKLPAGLPVQADCERTR